MKKLVFILIAVAVAIAGCHSGKSAAERAPGKRIAELADSVKYETLRADFEKGDFLFRISRIGDLDVDQAKSRVVFYDGKVWLQVVTNMRTKDVPTQAITKNFMNVSGTIMVGEIESMEKTINQKKHTVTLKGKVSLKESLVVKKSSSYTFTLYMGSNKGYGFIGGYSYFPHSNVDLTYEGWYEPVTPADTTGYVPLR